MKFSNGNWLKRKGMSVHNPAEVYDMQVEEDSVILYAPCTRIQHRGATLGGPLLTIKLSSPMENVIRVQAHHYMGGNDNGPEFELNATENKNVSITNNDNEVILKSGDLSVRVEKDKAKEWAMDFFNGDKRLTGSKSRSLGYVIAEKNGPSDLEQQGLYDPSMEDALRIKKTYMMEQLDLGVGEYVYGLGERFTPFVKNGQSVDTWNEDGGTSTLQSYKNIPFYITNKGYGVFVNHPENVSYEIASEWVSKVQFSVEGEYLDYFIINGPEPKKIIENYTALTGRPSLPPAWTFGLWLTTSFTTNYDEKTVSGFVDGFAERDLPLHTFHFDCFWMKDFEWCNFEWDSRVFPDPVNMIKRLKEKGLKICVWINSYIAQKSKLFEEGKKNGYFIKRVDGSVWQWDMWQPGMALVDFTNPAACKWFGDKLRALVDMGVDCFKTDFGERVPTDGVYFDGSDPKKMHNYYTYLYNKVVFEVLEEKLGKNEAALFARSATVGGQKFPVHWGGDCFSNFQAMSESLRGGLSLGISGFGFWSHDIGGFESTSTPDVYKRWLSFGLLSSHSRLHGSTSYRVPWLYDEEAVDVTRFFTKLKCSLMPYTFSKAVEATQKGTPVMRAMLLEFPEDPTSFQLDRQYMFGDSLLVAPVLSEDHNVTYYVPNGTWTNYITGEKIEGGRWKTENHGYLTMPLLVKENTILAVGAVNNKPDYDYADGVTLKIYELKDGKSASAVIYDTKAKVTLKVAAKREGNKITVSLDGTVNNVKVLLPGVSKVSGANAGTVSNDQSGVLVTIPNGTKSIEINL